jgi:serine/threonine-protein kinase
MIDLEELRAALASHLADHYALDQEELGSGGMAVVYGARDIRHGRRVAVKLMRPDQAIVFGADRFLREIRVTAGLQHPHILPLLDSGAVAVAGITVPYYVMPLVTGQSLRTRLDVEGRLGLDEVVSIARDVGDGLQYAHDRGIVHRDIKPENVLLNESGAALIADFGLAQATGGDHAGNLTERGTRLGTPVYMSPEQLTGGGPVNDRSDQFGVAAMIFEMLAGRAPYEGDTRDALLARRFSGPPDSLQAHRPDLAPAIAAVLAKGLAQKPEDRYPSTKDLVEALSGAIDAEAGRRAASAPRRIGARRVGAALAFAGAAVGIGAAAIAWSDRRAVRNLSDGAMVVLADVQNLTADSTLGPALRVSATVALQQSSAFSLYPRTRLRASLARMGRTISDTVLSEPLAREIAYRESGQAVIVLSVADVGGKHTIACRLVDPTTGQDLAARQETAAGADELLPALDRLVEWTRRRLGDNNWERSAPLPLVTTSSLPALRAYADGRIAYGRSDWESAKNQLERSIQLDTGFAMAQMLLGQFHIVNNRIPEGLRWLREADRRTGRLTEPEQLNVKTLLARAEGRESDQIAFAHALATRYPSALHWHLYAEALRGAERYLEAIPAYEKALAIDSTSASTHYNLALAHKALGNNRTALDHFGRVDQLDSTVLLRDFSNQQWGETFVRIGDFAAAEAAFRRMLVQPLPRDQARGHRSLAYLALHRGRFAEAVAALHRSIPLQPRGGLSEYRDLVLLADAELTRGRKRAAEAALERAFQIFRKIEIQAAAVMFGGHQLIRAGQLGRGRLFLDSLEARAALRPNSAQDQAALKILTADLALAQGQTERAAAALARTDFAGYNALGLSLRADLFAARRELDSAVAMAKAASEARIFGVEVQQDWLRSFAQLARLAERAGDPATARAAYSALLEQWRDGDPDLPPLVAARAELTRLQAVSSR